MDNCQNLTGTEGYYRGTITIGDNGYCRWTRMQPSSQIQTLLFHLDSSVAGSFINSNTPDSTGQTYDAENGTRANYMNLTTSYGSEQGSDHIGVQYQSTWDNQWHLHFSQYYYYGAGLMAYMVSTTDPRVCYRIQNTNTQYGCSPIASGTTGFVFSHDQNADGENQHFHNFNMLGAAKTMDEIATNATSGMAAPRGQIFTYTDVTLSNNYQTIATNDQGGLVPNHGSQSTAYPRLMNVNWWPTKDGRMQYSGDY
jgi:hypothetical protein